VQRSEPVLDDNYPRLDSTQDFPPDLKASPRISQPRKNHAPTHTIFLLTPRTTTSRIELTHPTKRAPPHFKTHPARKSVFL